MANVGAACPVCGTRLGGWEAVGRHVYAKGRIDESRAGAIERPHHDWVRARFGKNARELKAKELTESMEKLVGQG